MSMKIKVSALLVALLITLVEDMTKKMHSKLVVEIIDIHWVWSITTNSLLKNICSVYIWTGCKVVL